jgi:hypothetical protein
LKVAAGPGLGRSTFEPVQSSKIGGKHLARESPSSPAVGRASTPASSAGRPLSTVEERLSIVKKGRQPKTDEEADATGMRRLRRLSSPVGPKEFNWDQSPWSQNKAKFSPPIQRSSSDFEDCGPPKFDLGRRCSEPETGLRRSLELSALRVGTSATDALTPPHRDRRVSNDASPTKGCVLLTPGVEAVPDHSAPGTVSSPMWDDPTHEDLAMLDDLFEVVLADLCPSSPPGAARRALHPSLSLDTELFSSPISCPPLPFSSAPAASSGYGLLPPLSPR